MEINPNLNAEAIFAKLDSYDKKGSDGKIEACIWNKFAKVAGGKEIKNEINKENAIKSISTYIARASDEVKKQIAVFLSFQGMLDDHMKEIYTEEQREYALMTDDELEAKRLELAEEVFFTKASNGMGYALAKEKLSELWVSIVGMGPNSLEAMFVHDLDAKKLNYLESAIRKYCPQFLNEFLQAKDAVEELESKNPGIKDSYESYKDVCRQQNAKKSAQKLLEKVRGRLGNL